MRLLALAGLLALSLAAQADILPTNYSVSINGAQSGTLGFANSFASINGVGVVPFSVYLTSNTANFTLGTQIYGPVVPSLTVNTVLFVGNRVADTITGFTLSPSSTLTGIVPSTSIATGPPGPFTYINFDFSKANLLPGETATLNLSFTPQASAPEIDPSVATSALMLIAGAMAILRTRRTA